MSYFKGPKEQWKTAIPTHAKIGYVQPWPGIDLAYDGKGGKLESIYTVAPHADPAQIKLRYSGQDSLRLDEDGNLVYTTSVGEVKETAPTLYQEIDGQRIPVEGAFTLLDEGTVGFTIAAYNPDHALVIDPTLVYAGYIGGSGNDWGNGIAVDSAGNAYVTGWTDSTAATFPAAVGPDLTFNAGRYDAFVTKVNPTGTALIYAGYIGGSGDTMSRGIAVDGAGNAYVTGSTTALQASFPVTVGPDVTHNCDPANCFYNSDAFVAKVNPTGTALVYAGYIGGRGEDEGNGIAVDSAGNAYVTGTTDSLQDGFPVTVGPDLAHNGYTDAFVAKVNSAGTALVYAGYIGGNHYDEGRGIAVDSAGNAYVTGSTQMIFPQENFPVRGGPDLTHNGLYDAFVAKVNPTGTALVYAGYIGGTGNDDGNSIAVDSAGNAYVTGLTYSSQPIPGIEGPSFPVTVGPKLIYNDGLSSFVGDAFVAKVNPTGTALVYAGYIGGSMYDEGRGIAVDGTGNAYVTGFTYTDRPPFGVEPDSTHVDAFVAKVNATGSALVYTVYIGGSARDEGNGIAVDSAGNAYVTGWTDSTQAMGFPVGGPDLTHNGRKDAFVAKIADGSGTAVGLPGPQTGWWWNPAQSGRGFTVEVSGNNMFMAGYLYADDGRATWLVSTGPMTSSTLYSGKLLSFGGGQTLNGPFKSNTLTNGNVGNVTLQFTDATHGTLTWPGGTIPIERFIFSSGTPTFQPETGWWWNEAESGRGFAIEIQGNRLFMAGYMYDDGGNPIWYVTEGAMATPTLYQGAWLQFANGQTLTGPFKENQLINGNAGGITLQFNSSTTATLTLPDGRQIPLTRFRF